MIIAKLMQNNGCTSRQLSQGWPRTCLRPTNQRSTCSVRKSR